MKLFKKLEAFMDQEFCYTPKQVIPIWIALCIFVVASLWMSILRVDIFHIAIDGWLAFKMTVTSIELIREWITSRHK